MGRVRKFLKFSILSTVGLLVLGGVLWLCIQLWSVPQLEAALEELRRSGAPVFVSDFAPEPLPEDENAATFYLKAFELPPAAFLSGKVPWKDPLASETVLDLWEELSRIPVFEWSEDRLGAIRSLLERNRQALDWIAQGAERRACQFPLDYTRDVDMLLPHLSSFRRWTKLLAFESLLLFREGRREAAYQRCRTAIRFSGHLSQEPILVCYLVSIAGLGITLDTLHQMLSDDQGDPQAYQWALEDFGKSGLLGSFVRCMEWERASGISVWQKVMKEDPGGVWYLATGTPLPRPLRLLGPMGRPILRLDEVEYLALMKSQIEVAKLPYPEAKGKMEKLDAASDGLPFYCFLTKMLAPASGAARRRELSIHARMDLARLAAAMKTYRYSHGSYPDSLELLAVVGLSDLPQDPFTGKSYMVQRKPEGFVVYSLGPDQTDDGGEGRKETWDEERDIVWRAKR